MPDIISFAAVPIKPKTRVLLKEFAEVVLEPEFLPSNRDRIHPAAMPPPIHQAGCS